MNCKNCGAPVDYLKGQCEYCGTYYNFLNECVKETIDDKDLFVADSETIPIRTLF